MERLCIRERREVFLPLLAGFGLLLAFGTELSAFGKLAAAGLPGGAQVSEAVRSTLKAEGRVVVFVNLKSPGAPFHGQAISSTA